ncbi:MAG: gfo/Idh/MocA family oxidoreductase [Bacteroidota bacterium]
MSDNLKKNVLVVGTTQMAIDYYTVLKELNCNVTIVGKSKENADVFYAKTEVKPNVGGLELFLSTCTDKFEYAIVAVGVEQLANSTRLLIDFGVKNILVEKPAGLSKQEIVSVSTSAKSNHANVFVAYNRRFYASVKMAQEIIAEDGGVASFNFEFTEWSHTIENIEKKPGVKENWLIANSSHVIDLAFYLGGKPAQIACFSSGELSWHKKSIFSGAGKTIDDKLFSYQANWEAPGRWSVEVLTKKHRLILRPMEDLQIQEKGSVAINKVEFNNELDVKFKPGIYTQTVSFLNGDSSQFKTLDEQIDFFDLCHQIMHGNSAIN